MGCGPGHLTTELASVVGPDGLVVGLGRSAADRVFEFVAIWAATMTPLVQAGHGAPQPTALWWALALGADLGGNAAAVGVGTDVPVVGIAARDGPPISFWR